MFAVEVEYDYEAELQDELTIHAGDILTSVKQMSGGWWEGVLKGKKGLFPENFVKVSWLSTSCQYRLKYRIYKNCLHSFILKCIASIDRF